MGVTTRTPVTIVTGQLGAGKTTLVNHLIQTSGCRLAVIVNEYGEIGIDGDLIETGAEELIELNAGCVCCVVRGDLIRTLRTLLADHAFDGVVIETTGLANPAPVIQTFLADQQLAQRCRLDGVVTVVDALHISGQLDASRDAADQIGLASTLLLNKTADAPDPAAIEASLRTLNPLAPIHRIDRGRADPSAVLDTGGYDLDRIAGIDRPEAHHDHGTDEMRAVCLAETRPLDPEKLHAWLTELLALRGLDILRTKGIVDTGDDRRLVIQAVHMLMEGGHTRPWPPGPRQSRLVLIGRNLDPLTLAQGLATCRATVTA